MFGDLIRRLRQKRGMTQSDLAAASGIFQPNISAIETGRRIPNIETCDRLVTSCGFNLAAVAGACTIPLRPVTEPHPGDPPPAPTPDQRRRDMVAVLELADAIVRSR